MVLSAAPVSTFAESEHERHGLSRREVMLGGVGLAGAVGAGWIDAAPAAADDSRRLSSAAPRAIPGGIRPFGPGTELFHVFFPGQGDPSTITDFKGSVGAAVIDGHGTGDNAGREFEIDMRFMDGSFVGLDGRRFKGAFTFV